MDVFVTGFDGAEWTLPDCISWKFEYGMGVPCDSFALVFPWTVGDEVALSAAVRLTAVQEGETVFVGVIDEFECRADLYGRRVFLTGRGKAALLLDNEARAADYLTATTADILERHVRPYGIEVASSGNLPTVSGFSVASGSSEWQVLYDFTRYHGGILPRFDREGRLHLEALPEGAPLILDDDIAVTQLKYCERRYGVLSEVLVQNKVLGLTQRVENTAFLQSGGRCRRVVNLPKKSGYRAMRMNGAFQIEQSRAGQVTLEVTVPQAFFAWPGDTVLVQRTGGGRNGVYRVGEVTVQADENGARSTAVLHGV